MNQLPRIGLAWVLLVTAQVFIFNAMGLGTFATPFPFILLILMLPFELPIAGVLVGAFLTGLVVDGLGDINSLGLHAFSLTLMAALRNYWIPVVSSSVRGSAEIDLGRQRLSWYAAYAFPLVMVHHLAFFLLDGRGVYIWRALFKALASGMYTFAICFLLIVIFYRKQ
ncbi:MAG: hypothetical protein AB8F95_10475 [Bacteroidia bacterium]